MPNEIRRLVFSNQELDAALRHYGTIYDVRFPEGKIIKSTFAVEGGGSGEGKFGDFTTKYNVEDRDKNLIVTFFNEKTFEHKMFSVTSDFISGALIQSCLDNNIPIPRRSRKKLDVTGFNVCLDIIIESEKASSLELED